jgi:hypothetical protein
VANGRPDRYPNIVGSNVAGENWFRQAMATRSGDEYVAYDIEASARLSNAQVATYAAAVRTGGHVQGKVLGVLGAFFDWQPQAAAVVNGVRLRPDERDRTRCLILDSRRRVIAASDGRGILSETFPLDVSAAGSQHGYYTDSNKATIGFSLTPGYETYPGLGWYGVIHQTPLSSR